MFFFFSYHLTGLSLISFLLLTFLNYKESHGEFILDVDLYRFGLFCILASLRNLIFIIG